MSSSNIRKGLRDLKGPPRDKKRVSSLALEIRSRVNGIKRSKRTAYKELKKFKNCKVPIETLLVYYI